MEVSMPIAEVFIFTYTRRVGQAELTWVTVAMWG